MRFRLRTLLIALAMGPPLLAGALVVRKDPWPLVLAVGFVAYFLIALAIACVIAWVVDHLKQLL